MKKIGNVLWGIVLIAVGVIFGINALEIADINIFFDGWWTLFIIVPCFIDLFIDEEKTGNIIGLLIGLCLLLCCQGVLDFSLVFKLIIPVILIIIGLSMICKDTLKKKIKEDIKKLNKKNPSSREYCSTFGGQTVDFTNEVFDGCELTAVFGGLKCNLKDATIEENCVINISAIFGGITIYTPEDVNVVVVSTSIFGGVSDDRKNKNKDSKATLYINATCIFGGVEVR